MKKQLEPTATARLVTPPRWQNTRALSSPPWPLTGERAHQGERVEVDALGLQAGGLDGLEQGLDHLAARGHEHDLHARGAVGRLGVAGDLMVEHGLVERHGDRL